VSKQRWALCLAVLGVALIGIWASLRHQPSDTPAVPRMPIPGEVFRITAQCLPFQDILPGTDEFVVPPEYVGDILRVLGQPQAVEDLSHFCDERAVLRLTCQDGRVMVVRLYFCGKEPVRYSIDGVHCRRVGAYVGDTEFPLIGGSPRYCDESNVLVEALRPMAQQPLDEASRSEVRRWLGRLDRSAGWTQAGGRD
jgi:hypothetical protein